MHKEIGGYLELERFSGPMMHEDALALSSGRACLSYLIEQRDIRKILLPDLLCDVVTTVCEERGVTVRRYAVGEDLRPADVLQPEKDEWLYLVNYYGQLSKEELLSWAKDNPRLIVDNAQAYFSAPVKGVIDPVMVNFFGFLGRIFFRERLRLFGKQFRFQPGQFFLGITEHSVASFAMTHELCYSSYRGRGGS